MRRVRTYVGAFLSPWGCHVSVSRLVSVAGTIAVGVALVFVAPGVPAYSDSTAPTAETSTTPDSSLAETSAPAETSQPASEDPSPAPSEASPTPPEASPTPDPTPSLSPLPSPTSTTKPKSPTPQPSTSKPPAATPGSGPPATHANPGIDLYPQPSFAPVGDNVTAALLQRLYDAQAKQRSVRNQIAATTAELTEAKTAVAAAEAELRDARRTRDQAWDGLLDIYKSGAPYGVYVALESPAHGVLGDGTDGAYTGGAERVGVLADRLAAAVDTRDEVDSRLAELRRSLRHTDGVVRKITRQVGADLVKALTSGRALIWPLHGPVTSGYGTRFDPYYHVWQLHAGIDIGAATGTPVAAAASGRVVQAGMYGGYGNYICLAHWSVRGQPMTTCYGHLSKIMVTTGQKVTMGQTIGLVGSTGAATGPHLHFEVRVGGRPTDPRLWLDAKRH